MTWSRAPVATALVELLEAAVASSTLEATVFAAPPYTLNPNSIVVARVTEVRYSIGGFSVDEAMLPVLCVAGQDQDDTVAALISIVRDAVAASLNLSGVVHELHAVNEHNWRHVNVSGADLLAAEITIQVLM